jgi:hypothetical protein
MKRRQALRALWAGSIVAALPGCNLLGNLRPNTNKVEVPKDKDKEKADEPIIKYSDEGDESAAKSFFNKGSYRRGALSSEGADIERSLGVGR